MPGYRNFFSLKQSPFEVQSIRPLVLETGPLRRVVTWIRSELAADAQLLTVFGSRGIGKSSTAMALPHLLEDRVACVSDPTQPWPELMASIATQLDLDGKTLSRAALLAGRPSPTVRLVLVVDDADELPDETLSCLQRVISYADALGRPLVRCILFANRDGRASQATRWVMAVKSRFELTPMLARELHRYVEARLENAGWKGGELFTRAAIEAIHHASGGSPPASNRICEALLVEASQRQERSIGQDLAEQICAELALGPMGAQEQATEPALRAPGPATAPGAVQGDALLASDRPAPATAEAADWAAPATAEAADWAAPATAADEGATEPTPRPPSGKDAWHDEAIPPPAQTDLAPAPEDRRAPEIPAPEPVPLDPVARPDAEPAVGAARWHRRRWQGFVAATGLTAAILLVGWIGTMKTGEPGTLEWTGGEAARGAGENAEPTLTASDTIVIQTLGPWLDSDHEFESAAGAIDAIDAEWTEGHEAVDPGRTEGGDPVASEPAEAPGPGVARASETQTPKPRKPTGWLDDLDLALDTNAGRPQTSSPDLALPEPELSHGFSPGGED